MFKLSMNYVLLLLLLVTFFGCQSNAESSETSEAKRPNVIFIMTDDHSKRAMSAYTDELMQTPHLDQLAKEGVLFDRAFCTNSICGPSRAVFLTGKFSHKNGFKSNHDTFDGDQPTLAKYLQAAGYHTSVVGKWHLVSHPQGFDEYKILIGQGEYYNPRFVTGTDTVRETGYSSTLITDHALSVIDRVKDTDQPFFMMLHHKAPHRNWMPELKHLKAYAEQEFEIHPTFFDDYENRSQAARMQDMEIKNMYHSADMKLPVFENDPGSGGMPTFDMGRNWKRNYESLTPDQKAAWDEYYQPIIQEYYEKQPEGKELAKWMYQRYLNDYTKSIMSVDDNVGRVLTYLKENNLDENTLIIYTSDQGFFTGEHGWYDKRWMYEPSLAIPLVVRYPKELGQGVKSNAMVQNVDLAPTILDFVGEPIPQDMQGTSLKGILKGEAEDTDESIYYHYYQSSGWHTVPKHIGVRTGRYKLIYYYEIDEWELFDLQNDPYEMNSIYGKESSAGVVTNLKEELQRLIEKYDDDTAPDLQL
jgi:uncharacterized sulfatase